LPVCCAILKPSSLLLLNMDVARVQTVLEA
jgi:hypothetical protein